MKKIGLIAGMSYESSVSYYIGINRLINERLGGLNSAEILLSSLNFEPIEKTQRQNEWQKAGEILAGHAKILELGGADFILICTNTMHKVYDIVQNSVKIPILHIAAATLTALQNAKVKSVLLLGTSYTMRENFYKEVLINGGVNVVVPNENDMKFINDTIFNGLCKGEISQVAKNRFLQIIRSHSNEIGGVILGCTEIGLLIEQKDSEILLFDTTQIHIEQAVNLALS
ncbi:L-aspartate/glutamate-specific racemase [Campylobacter majalis]|uniref:L-aspartate/glutamate-specific racemase n=1 Tax=Campylobacter majalis TaxID=2790656 RepID=A0ABM8Q8V2_9BACT|nr:aspartate/glutamate racemase family protein [Campylobacter majalis]CAD7289262.1 L-aspartate/glutamate-specific racemase [Campylobacter majalis]